MFIWKCSLKGNGQNGEIYNHYDDEYRCNSFNITITSAFTGAGLVVVVALTIALVALGLESTGI